MERDRTPTRLARLASLLELAEARLGALTEGDDHPRVSDAHAWLRSARTQVVRAGALGYETRSLLSVLLAGGAIWAVATLLGEVIGLPGGWTAAITLPLVMVGLSFPIAWLLNAVDRAIGRRRTTRPRPAAEATPPPAKGILALLRLARGELAELLRERSRGHPTAGDFDRLQRRDARVDALGAADRAVCAAMHAVEIWLSVAGSPAGNSAGNSAGSSAGPGESGPER